MSAGAPQGSVGRTDMIASLPKVALDDVSIAKMLPPMCDAVAFHVRETDDFKANHLTVGMAKTHSG